jgi:outer membrane receptor protein involved in Fe transport
LEFELDWQARLGWLPGARLGLLHTGSDIFFFDGADYSGKRSPNAPRSSASVFGTLLRY